MKVSEMVRVRLLDFEHLTMKEQEDFNHIKECDHTWNRFFRFKGMVFDLQEMEPTSEAGADLKHPCGLLAYLPDEDECDLYQNTFDDFIKVAELTH